MTETAGSMTVPIGGSGPSGKGLLPLVLGGLAVVLALAWTLSQCSGDEDNGPDDDASRVEQADDAATGVIESSVVAAGDEGAAGDQAADDQPGDTAAVVEPGADEGGGGTTAEPSTLNEELRLEPVTFEVRSSRITAEGTAVLDQAAAYLAANADVNVEIAGHTDADGDEAANLALSQARAEAVKAYLVSSGIDGSRLTPTGYGETAPIAPNDTAEGKARNRRIEFVIR